jgi:hypothetical protein
VTFVSGLVLCVVGGAQAQVTVSLPDTSQTTTMTAVVSEQARVVVPPAVMFTVSDVSVNTPAAATSVSVSQIVLASASKQLRVSVRASSAAFTPPQVGAASWAASDVSWNAATWTNATGASGALDAVSYSNVATCDPDSAACSTTGLVFTLAANPAVQLSGNHTLPVVWKFESF